MEVSYGDNYKIFIDPKEIVLCKFTDRGSDNYREDERVYLFIVFKNGFQDSLVFDLKRGLEVYDELVKARER